MRNTVLDIYTVILLRKIKQNVKIVERNVITRDINYSNYSIVTNCRFQGTKSPCTLSPCLWIQLITDDRALFNATICTTHATRSAAVSNGTVYRAPSGVHQ